MIAAASGATSFPCAPRTAADAATITCLLIALFTRLITNSALERAASGSAPTPNCGRSVLVRDKLVNVTGL
jgi:hypothetical protein